MRLAFVLMAACGGAATTAPITTKAPLPPLAVPITTRVVAPEVKGDGVVSTDDGRPPIVVLIDAQGQRRLAAAASWGDAGAAVWSAGPKTAQHEASVRAVLQASVLGEDPKLTVDGFADSRPESATGLQDDPPPPEEEEESGGYGTAMALEEGKMGRKPSAPAVGPWRGPIGNFGFERSGRYAGIVGEVTSAKPERVPAVVIADPATKATEVVAAVTDLEAMIGVWSAGALRPLRIQFHRDRDHEREPAADWLDVEVATSVTIDGKPVDLAAIKPAIAEAITRRRLGASAAVDVLVGPEVATQKLIDVLVALDRAGVTSIGLGLVPTDEQRKANLPPVVSNGQLNSVGDLDKAIIRRFVKANIQKITYCYEKELLAIPNLRGTVQVQFFIRPDGKVASSSGAGMNADVASCVAGVIKTITFPKPKGGGGVQVNYPFTFRPEGANKP